MHSGIRNPYVKWRDVLYRNYNLDNNNNIPYVGITKIVILLIIILFARYLNEKN